MMKEEFIQNFLLEAAKKIAFDDNFLNQKKKERKNTHEKKFLA